MPNFETIDIPYNFVAIPLELMGFSVFLSQCACKAGWGWGGGLVPCTRNVRLTRHECDMC